MRRLVPLALAGVLVLAGVAIEAGPVAAQQGSAPRPVPMAKAAARHWAVAKPRASKRQLAAVAAAARAASSAPVDPVAMLSQGSGQSTTAEVTLSGTASLLTSAVHAAQGRVVAQAAGRVTAVVPKSALGKLRRQQGVQRVERSIRAVMTAGPTSEGVAASNAGPATTAGTWQQAGITGSGVSVAIVDGGFAGLANAVTAGDLPAGLTVTSNHCANVNDSDHGTAVAEIVHQMAPAATLHLYCIDDPVGLQQIEPLIAANDQIASCSLALPGEARGDGTGASDSAEATVATLRRAGVLWINAAGNAAADHWSGTLADSDGDGLADLDGVSQEVDGVYVAGTDDVPGGGSADLILQWDQWPTSSAPIAIAAIGHQCTDDACSGKTDLNGGEPVVASQDPGTEPVVYIPVTNTSKFEQEWDIAIFVDPGFPKVHYDLTYLGDTAPSYFASDVSASRAAAGSILSPASSPYALAVGAADVGAGDGVAKGSLETFSSRGPTIDGRVKPEITGWDGVSSPVYGSPASGLGFYGTSAAAPAVAGAAALVKSANPALDAAQVQDFLQRRASDGSPNDPPTNSAGYGLLTLGAPTGVTAPAGARYTPIAPTRILDTRTTTGGHHGVLGAGGTATVTVPDLPADATAVAVNLTGTSATTTTYMSAYPGDTAFPGTSNLNLSKTDSTAAVFAIVTVHDGKITVRNNNGSANAVVDELGYFGTGSETGLYTSLPAARRVLDTRTTVGAHHAKLTPGQSVTVHPALPDDATAAIVNVTSTDTSSTGFLSAAPTCSSSASTLNFSKYTRANLAVVGMTAGRFCVIDHQSAADVVVDVVGYIGADGSAYVALPAAQRIIDTRTGNGGSAGQHPSKAIGANSFASFYGSDLGIVPHTATALLTGVVATGATANGYLTVFPGVTKPSPLTSNLNFTIGRTVPNAVIAGLSGNRFSVYNLAGSTHAVTDLFGYFAPAG